MKISTKGRYALRVLTNLALHQDGYVALKTIAESEGISKKYLEQIVPVLNKGNLLITNRGFQGGYRLAKAPENITVAEVLRLTEGNMAPVACLDPTTNVANCDRSSECPTLPVWIGLNKVINEYLESVTIKDIANNSTSDYVI